MNISVIVPAAGSASRFGADKRCLRMPGGESLLAFCTRRLRALFDDVSVVLRPDDRVLADTLAELECRVIVNPQPQHGMGSSLACGVRATADADAWLVMPGDLPLVRAQTFARIGERLADADAVVPVCHGRRGHPVGFGRRFRERLTGLHGVTGGRALLRGADDAVVWLNVHDPGIYQDVDTPEDARRLARRLNDLDRLAASGAASAQSSNFSA